MPTLAATTWMTTRASSQARNVRQRCRPQTRARRTKREAGRVVDVMERVASLRPSLEDRSMASYDEGLVGLLEAASELFEDWTWACALDGGSRIVEARPLDAAARSAVERWAMELLGDTASGALEALERATDARGLAIRAFVVDDPRGQPLAVMGFGPPQSVSAEGDVILDALAQNLRVFGRQPATG